MTDSVYKDIVIRAISEGFAKTEDEARQLTAALDALRQESDDDADRLEELSKVARRLESSFRGGKTETQKYAEGFGELVARANAAKEAMQQLAQEQVVAGSVSPLQDVAAGTSLEEARELLAIRKAQGITDTQVANEVVANARRQEQEQARAARAAADAYQSAIDRKIAGEMALAQRVRDTTAAQEAQQQAAVGGRDYNNDSVQIDAAIDARRRESQQFAASLQARLRDEEATKKQTAATSEATQVTNQMTGSLPRLRYALYDVSTTLSIAGIAMTGLATATAATAITMDRQFADVVRTTGTYMSDSAVSAGELRDEFNDLFAALPASWADLTDIGTLAGQLGVASENVAEFTNLVAKFASVTDVTVEQSATAFGRLAELLDVPATEFENLGSSILAVGVNSVATESQIVNTSAQLASMGNFAGFSADEVFGLSAALASLGTQPELSRGTITRLFTNITNSISEGSDALDTFGRLAGMTGAEFADAWGADASGALTDFLTGLGKIEGSGAIRILDQLGITAARDVPTILRLAQNSDLLAESLQIASDGYAEGSALQDQYGVIAETVASKLTVLKNNVQLVVAAFGESDGVLAGVIDGLTKIVQGFAAIADNEVAQKIGLAVVAFTALAGVTALVVGGLARVYASAIAIRTSLIEMAGAAYTAKTGLDAAGASTWQLVAASNGLKTALISTGIGAALVALGTAAAFFVGQSAQAEQRTQALADSFDTLTGAITNNTRELAFNALQQSGALEAARTLGISFDTVVDAALGSGDAMERVGLAIRFAREQAAKTPEGYGLLNPTQELDNAATILTQSLGEQVQAMDEARQLSEDRAAAGLDAADADYETASAADEAADALAGLSDETASLTDGLFDIIDAELGLNDALYGLGESVAKNGGDFSTFTAAGRANIESLKKAVSAAAASAGGDAGLFAAYVQEIINSLVAAGVQGAESLSFVRAALNGGTASSLDTLVARNAQLGAQLAAGYESASKSAGSLANNAGRAAKNTAAAKEEIRTITDYVSDLSKAFKTAFDIRFGLDEAQDSTTSALQAIRDGFDDARQRARDLRLEIGSLTATITGIGSDKQVLNYQLGVAREYGDTLREQQILAELEKKNAELAEAQANRSDKQKELTKTEQEATPTTKGNTEAALEQRDAILGLLRSYQDQITAYANTGASQEQVRQYSQRLRTEFKEQLTQLGYNREEVGKYAKALEDATTIIDGIPRNVTTKYDIKDAASRAIQEILDKGSQFKDKTATYTTKAAVDDSAMDKLGRGTALYASIVSLQNQIAATLAGTSYWQSLVDRLKTMSANLSSGNYYTGGYTGRGGMYEPAGTVHRGEYVIPKRDVNQATGLPYADALDRLSRGMAGRMGYANGGYVNPPGMMMVELGPQSLRAIERGGSVMISLDGKPLAASVNQANAVTTGTVGVM